MSSKSQISLEFMVIFGFLILLLTVFMFFFIQEQQDALEQGDFLETKAECLRIASTISSVYSSGDGTVVRTWTSKEVSLNEEFLEIGDIGCSYSADISPKNITGNIAITNKGGTVFLESY